MRWPARPCWSPGPSIWRSAEGSEAPLLGVLIGCFGDPGLFALRESSACPVTGLAEASFIEAARRGRSPSSPAAHAGSRCCSGWP
jgi:hypothetical protein